MNMNRKAVAGLTISISAQLIDCLLKEDIYQNILAAVGITVYYEKSRFLMSQLAEINGIFMGQVLDPFRHQSSKGGSQRDDDAGKGFFSTRNRFDSEE